MTPQEIVENMDPFYALFGQVNIFGNHLQAVGDSFYEEITYKQFLLLICLKVFETPPTANELAEVMGCSHQNVKVILEKLEAKGIVTLTRDENDQRKLRIAATKKSEDISEKYQNRQKDFMAKLYDGISKEEAKLTLQILSKMENNLSKIVTE